MSTVWEFVFLMLILKIPIVYLCWVVWWAVKAEPHPPELAALVPVNEPDSRRPWQRPQRPLRPRRGPHGSPTRGYARPPARAPLT